MEAKDEITGFDNLADETCVGPGMGGDALGEAVYVDGDGRVNGEGVVDGVAGGGHGEGGPAGGGLVKAGDGEAGVPLV